MIDQPSSSFERYEIRLRGHLDARWRNQFTGMSITLEEDGDTLLSGFVVDQAALHGLLKKIRDLGMPLVSVNHVQFSEPHPKIPIKGEKMISSATSQKWIDTKMMISMLWIVVMFNMLKADILSIYIPGAAEELAKTAANSGTPIPQLMLAAAVMMEVSIAMIILSLVLKYRINRWANILVSVITIAFIIAGGSSYPHYLFIAAVEVICLVLIIWLAWQWRNGNA